jgi:hypothetical protein
VPLRRIRQREATYAGFASPDCAAPSGFLSLVTLCSSRGPSGFVSCQWRPWGSPFRGLFLPRSRHGLPASHPLLTLSSGRDRPTDPVRPRPVARLGSGRSPTSRDESLCGLAPCSLGAAFGATVSRSATASKEGHQPGAHAATSRESVRESEDHACDCGWVPAAPLLALRLLRCNPGVGTSPP